MRQDANLRQSSSPKKAMVTSKPISPAIAPDHPRTEDRGLTEIGWGQGEMNDGRPWLASLWEDHEGDRTLSLAFPAMEYEDIDEETLLLRLIEENLVVPLEACDIEFFICEKRDDLFSPNPIWMVEILLSDSENHWAKPGFTVRDLSEYRVH